MRGVQEEGETAQSPGDSPGHTAIDQQSNPLVFMNNRL